MTLCDECMLYNMIDGYSHDDCEENCPCSCHKKEVKA